MKRCRWLMLLCFLLLLLPGRALADEEYSSFLNMEIRPDLAGRMELSITKSYIGKKKPVEDMIYVGSIRGGPIYVEMKGPEGWTLDHDGHGRG